MILVGIDVSKEKHECFIRTLEGSVLYKPFSIANNIEGVDYFCTQSFANQSIQKIFNPS